MALNIRIGFSQPVNIGFTSRAIMWFQESEISHTWFQVTIEGREMVIGADENGLVMQSLERFLGGNKVLFQYDSKDLGFDLDQGWNFLCDTLDEGYDFTGLVGMIWVELGRKLGKEWKNPWDAAGRMFCSESAAAMLYAIAFPDSKVMEPGSTDPQRLKDFLEHRKQSLLLLLPAVAV